MEPSSTPVRVRIAPSPTGFFHIGTARTALFNWLFARHMKGQFIVRIEDTDRERSTKEFEKNILEGIAWLGLDYDEGPLPDGTSKGSYGPYRQTERLDSYEKYLRLLLAEGKAYYCFCSKEDLEVERKKQEVAGVAPRYAGTCAGISQEDAAARVARGEHAVIRLKVSPEKVSFTDRIRGEVTFDNALTGDIVIAKNLREPLYNFAVVIDDYEMKITHVIRGEDHVANTPKQIAIADALGVPRVEYAHLPLILNPDRSKMSKRFNATSVDEYRAQGYLPEAMMNFLALLGWHPAEEKKIENKENPKSETGGGETEVMSREELVAAFDIGRVQKGGAIFNIEKLNFFNQQYLKKISAEEIAHQLVARGLAKASDLLIPAIALVRDRAATLAEIPKLFDFVFELPEYDSAILVWKKGTPESAREHLSAIAGQWGALASEQWSKGVLDAIVVPRAETHGKGDVFWPLRVALSGREQSPAPVDIAVALGKERTLERLTIALKKLENNDH